MAAAIHNRRRGFPTTPLLHGVDLGRRSTILGLHRFHRIEQLSETAARAPHRLALSGARSSQEFERRCCLYRIGFCPVNSSWKRR